MQTENPETSATGACAQAPPVRILLIESRLLIREGMKLILRERGYEVIAEADNVTAALRNVGGCMPAPQVILYGFRQYREEPTEPLRTLREAFPECRLVVQAEPDISPTWFANFVEVGVNGCLLMDISPEILRRSLDLVMLGERVFPVAIFMAHLQANRTGDGISQTASPNALSLPEAQVLRHLASGQPNKAIARELKISEATVKVYMKLLFKRIGASNRTQAAIWAAGKRTIANAA
jgi:two-component system, NarL family, nitrate/nitrite response regulator NarL